MNKRNILLLIFAAVMTFAISVSAEKTLNDLTYETENGKITITGYTKYVTNVTIPTEIDGCPVTSVGNSAFYGCIALTSITIPNSVTSISDHAFSRTGLTSINIPDSVTTIGEEAFSDCLSLTSINIPDSVINIGANPFFGCNHLREITVNKNNDAYISVDGVLFSKDKKTLISFPGGKTGEYSVPDGITCIGDHAFSRTGLTSINIPDSVITIGKKAFSGCKGLTVIDIPQSVTNIGEETFSGCDGLTSINIPEGVSNIGIKSFEDCTNLTEITVDENNSAYSSADGVLLSKDKKTLISFPCGKTGEYSVPDGITCIGDFAFSRCVELTNINIPESVTNIGEKAFWSCFKLTSINIPDGVTSIGNSAFSLCLELTNINIPESVTSIGETVFRYCQGIINISIPDSVIDIKQDAFKGLHKLENIYYTGTREQWQSIEILSGNDSLLNAAIHYEWKPISVLLNGNAINFDVFPQIINDRTMVPLRAIFEALGAEVEWIDRDENDKEIISVKGNKKISMKINEALMKVTDNVSGESRDITLDTPATLIDSRTLVPVRAISEAFGCDVQWDGDLKQVVITEQ